MDTPKDAPSVRCNLVVLWGTMANEPTRRELASGMAITQFDITTPLRPPEPGGSVSVPVAWPEAPPTAERWLLAGEQFVVIGTVRRRFFRVNGATQSRTEVVADQVIPARRVKTAQRAIDAAVASLSP